VNYLPLFFDLRGLRVLVVGAGAVALRKVQLLERAHAAIIVVAPQVAPELEKLAAAGTIELRVREFAAEDLDGARLVIVATARRAVNRWIASLAEARGIPVNVVDDRKASRVIVPAIIDRDPVIVAVSSAGTSPVLARRLRERLEALVPKRIGLWADWLAGLRAAARRRLPSTDARRRYFEMLVDGPAERRFVAGDERGAQRIAQRLMAAGASPAPTQAGEVTLVGAGPGDPELLTLKALRALQDADVILHDRLVPEAVLDYARRDAERVCVGKAARGGGTSQEAINDLLIEHARRGRRVVRLKGGDPFIFGRGGEELEALARAGIAYSVVPGISAANGCAAYAGIPLTHRDHAHSVSFVTGHGEQGGDEPDWASLARPKTTAVFYMGLARLDHILARLIENGAPAERPAALIAQGTTAEQQVVVATLGTLRGTLRGRAAARRIESPALLVVGEVASLHEALAWFGESPAADSEPQSA
jgi:uroporphyrin-III C-methyltransferase/precorrin-2 dehydrogenase/sirohydrochlorin ferrochelatase